MLTCKVSRRFNTAITDLQRNSSESTWTRLEGCNIFDVKARKVGGHA